MVLVRSTQSRSQTGSSIYTFMTAPRRRQTYQPTTIRLSTKRLHVKEQFIYKIMPPILIQNGNLPVMLPGAIKCGSDGRARLLQAEVRPPRAPRPAQPGGTCKRNRRLPTLTNAALIRRVSGLAAGARAEAEAERRPRTAWHAPYQALANNAFLNLAQLLEVRPLAASSGRKIIAPGNAGGIEPKKIPSLLPANRRLVAPKPCEGGRLTAQRNSAR